MSVPARANTDKTIKQVHEARSAMWRRRGRSEWAVMARKVGTAAIGSTRTKIDVNATRENWRRGGTSSSYKLWPEVAVGVDDDIGCVGYIDVDRAGAACWNDGRVSHDLALERIEGGYHRL